MRVLSTNELLALFKFDDTAIVFLKSEAGMTTLNLFSRLGRPERIEVARMLVSRAANADLGIWEVNPSNFPVALPSGYIIALTGGADLADETTPVLDTEGFPTNPAQAMAVLGG